MTVCCWYVAVKKHLNMEVNVSRNNDEVTVRLAGRLDTPAAQEIAPRMEELEADAAQTLILDCSELSYISSSGLRIFLSLRKAASDKGGRVIVRSINDDIRSVFMMTGFLNLFEIQ